MGQRLVLKFGGTSVGSAEAMDRPPRSSTLQAEGHEVAVVTSAMSGVTDLLLGSAQSRGQGRAFARGRAHAAIRSKHETAANALGLRGDDRHLVLDPIAARLGELSLLCDALGVLGEASPRALDAVGALGERMSVHLLAAALRSRGVRRRRSTPPGWSHRRHIPGGHAADGRDRRLAAASCCRCWRRKRSRSSPASSAPPPPASSRRWGAAAATTPARSSARPSTPTRSGSGPTSTA